MYLTSGCIIPAVDLVGQGDGPVDGKIQSKMIMHPVHDSLSFSTSSSLGMCNEKYRDYRARQSVMGLRSVY